MATPIGTLSDLSPRAQGVLRDVDLILAEDTRRTRRLLTAVEVSSGSRLRSLHEHNEEHVVDSIVGQLLQGRSVALVSDAGTPVLADPGFLLIRAAREKGVRVCSVPGPSAMVAALAASGQPPLPALLVGFLPPRSGQRRARLAELAELAVTMVVFLSPHRLRRELTDVEAVLGGQRPATLLAELSKQHERALMGTLTELLNSHETEDPRGEYVLVVGPSLRTDARSAEPEAVRQIYRAATKAGFDRREALRHTAAELGISRREVFAALVESED